MAEPIIHFLLVFNHRKGCLVDLVEFGVDSDSALAAYAAKERDLQGYDTFEVVLSGSDSIETVRLTDANYFEATAPVSRHLVGI